MIEINKNTKNMNLEELKRQLEKESGIVDYNLSDKEIIQIYERIKDIPPSDLTEDILHEAICDVTGIDSFLEAAPEDSDALDESEDFNSCEALDNSDIDDIIGQINDALKQGKK